MLKYDVTLEIKFFDSEPWDKVFTVNARVGDDTATEEEDERIFYYYETFEEILQNNAVDFTVLSINDTDINEFV
jgi:hypothetical protein